MKYPIYRAIKQLSGQQKYDTIKSLKNPNKDSKDDILNFEHYFDKYTLLAGKHGPELKNEKVYISIYHYLEYNGINPNKYDTFKIGGHLSGLTGDFEVCEYKEQDYDIQKYEYHFIKSNESIFDTYLK